MRANTRRLRRGSLLVEVTAAAVIVVVCCALLAQMLFLIARQERTAEARQVAWLSAANRLEQLLAREWADLPVAEAAEGKVPAELLRLLPTAQMRTQVIAVEDGAARQVSVEIVWRDQAGVSVQPVSLSAWKHRPPTEVQP